MRVQSHVVVIIIMSPPKSGANDDDDKNAEKTTGEQRKTTTTTTTTKRMSNIESLLVHTMPLVRCVEKTSLCTSSSKKTYVTKKDFELKDLWSAFHETSAFGCEVPLVVRNEDNDDDDDENGLDDEDEVIAQYYASYVSAFQIFEKEPGEGRQEHEEGSSAVSTKKDPGNGASAQYFESLAPYSRPPLMDVIERLAEENEKVLRLKASEIDREKSWFCFAWYPIYRIPQGTSRSDIQGCFLTYHGLNHLDIADEEDDGEGEDGDENEEERKRAVENKEEKNETTTMTTTTTTTTTTTKTAKGLFPPPPASLTLSGETRLQRRIEDAKKSVLSPSKDRRRRQDDDDDDKTDDDKKNDDDAVFVGQKSAFLPLRPFGLCCYKTDPEIWEESDEAENARTAAMIDGAYAFLRSMEVIHPDYEFFVHHG